MISLTTNNTYIESKGDRVVTIGNPDIKGEFCSHVSCKIWDEDVISFEEEDIKGTPTEKDAIVSLDTPARKMEWYYTGDNLHWVENLKSKPATNKWQLKVNANDFKFLYQPPLEDDAVAGSVIEYFKEGEVDWVRHIWPDGGVDARPLNINNSIAVYHRTKEGNNYKCGKALHILRPRAVAADGKWEWCDIEVKDGIYTRTTPQSFLDTAAYPVRINDDFGFTSIGGTPSGLGPDRDGAFGPYTAPSAGNATAVSFYWTGLTSTPITTGIWTDAANFPVDIVGQSAGAVENTDGWVTQSLMGTPAITATTYYTAFNCDDDQPSFRYDTDASFERNHNNKTYSAGNLTDPYDSVGSTPTGSRKYSSYITYTPSGGPAGIEILRRRREEL